MRLVVLLESYGVKCRPAQAAQLSVDARVLDNPARVEELRDRTGLDDDVADYVLSQRLAHDLLAGATMITLAEIDGAIARQAERVRIVIYCTGGKHRSVALIEDLARRVRLTRPGVVLAVEHLDIASGREDWGDGLPPATPGGQVRGIG